MIMCDYCLVYYHPDCIGLSLTEKEAETISSFKCIRKAVKNMEVSVNLSVKFNHNPSFVTI